ncbi:MAG: zinc-finger domain-containing protein [Geminicoccaceae bacterium]
MNKVVEEVKVDSRTVSCDGGAGQLGHPRVFLAIDERNQVACPYCGQIFVLDPGKPEADH